MDKIYKKIALLMALFLISNVINANDLINNKEIIVDISDQRLYLIDDSRIIESYPISSSKYGEGSIENSFKTPLGKHIIKEKIARTEIFGPVLSVMPFETEEEAIKIANDTPYGLTNYIQTQDPEKVKRVARKLRSGMVDVNGAGIAVDAPFGGFKHSGIGREAGEHGLEEFLEVKSVGGWN